ncbi:MAG: lysophospholipid acyltransferase family protein [Acidobacteriia bacterium]|nr:lysophospholipid acyltransferase family protein [Terriglobia bacterium]
MSEASSQEKAFTRWQRFQIWCMQYIGFCAVYLIGRTLRWESRGEDCRQEAYDRGKRVIFTFWHGRILPSTWYYRKRGIVVMTSMNFDGEYIARFIHMHGYGAARGSSSRGGLRALAEMARHLAGGRDVAFTVDGPRGPRYEAKLGPVILARKTGCPIFCFHVSANRYLQLNSWDHFQIPAPFSRVLILRAPLIWVPPDADEEAQRAKHHEMQQVLDRLRAEGDSYWQNRKVAGRKQ